VKFRSLVANAAILAPLLCGNKPRREDSGAAGWEPDPADWKAGGTAGREPDPADRKAAGAPLTAAA
jgi:hypothetical protein